MRSDIHDVEVGAPGLQALARALEAIAVPRVFKQRLSRGRNTTIKERVVFSDVTFAELIQVMRETEAAQVPHQEVLMTALGTLASLGIVEVSRAAVGGRFDEQIRIRATSEPAGYLLHSLSRFLTTAPLGRSPIQPHSSTAEIKTVLERALDQERLNPHLLLAILLERCRANAEEDPIRSVRVISVLIKGEEAIDDSDLQKEPVYLHVRKPDWDSYALVGSVQNEGQQDIETARTALAEDLEGAVNLVDLKPSGVRDERDVQLSITHGALTLYSFNLFTAESLHGELNYRKDVDYAWFTYEEICDQVSKSGHPIITKKNLVQRINDARGLDSVPAVVTDPQPRTQRSVSLQAREVAKEFVDLFTEFKELFQVIWIRLWSAKWWVLLLLAAMCLAFVLPPIVTHYSPFLSKIADIVGIIGFFISLVGLVLKLLESKKQNLK